MATKLVRYELTTGETVVVEETVDDHGAFTAADGIIVEAKQKFEDALAMLRPATTAVMAEIAGLAQAPEEVSLELGFSLKAEVGAVIAKTAAEGSFKLSLTWKPSRKSPDNTADKKPPAVSK